MQCSVQGLGGEAREGVDASSISKSVGKTEGGGGGESEFKGGRGVASVALRGKADWDRMTKSPQCITFHGPGRALRLCTFVGLLVLQLHLFPPMP